MNAWERRLAVAALVVGVVLLFFGASSLLVEQRLSSGASYPLIAGIALLICYGILDPTAVRDLVSSRRSRFGTLSVLVTAIVLGIVVMGNVLAARSTQSLDLTRYKVNTLAPESTQVTRRLDTDARVTLWDNNSDPSLTATTNLLSRYQAVSKHFRFTVTDPNFDPDGMEAKVLSAMAGQITISKPQMRIRSIKGTLVDDVRIGFGVLARMHKGGSFQVERREVVPHHWQVTESRVHILGPYQSLQTAKNAVCRLIIGAPPGKVYCIS